MKWRGEARGAVVVCMVLALTGCEGKMGATTGAQDRFVNSGGEVVDPVAADMAPSGNTDMSGVVTDMTTPPGDQGMVEDPDAGVIEPALPADPGLKRLTDTQYRNTLTSVIDALDDRQDGPDWPTQVVLRTLNSSSELDSRLNGVPPFGVYTRVAIAASNQIAARRGFHSRFLDLPEAERAAELRAWLGEQGHLFFRRPMTDDEITYYTQDVASSVIDQKALREVLTALFLSPHFLFHIEHGVEMPDDPQRVALTPWEVASRLAFFLWRSAPDDELYALAKDGTLLEPDVLRAQTERLLRDPRSDDFLHMFAIKWLGIKLERIDYRSIVQFDRFKITFNGEDSGWDQQDYNEFFGSHGSSQRPLREVMLEDMTAYMRHVIITREGSLRDLFTTTVATSADPRISDFYGVAPWDGTGNPPTHDAERGGILGRVLSLGDAAENTHPILRGLHIRESVLCQKMNPPPMDFIFRSPPSPPFSTREMVDYTTGPDNVGCWACHQLTNGLGFALDGYDVFGRKRDTEYYFRSRKEREAIRDADDTISRWEDVPMGAPVEVNATSTPRLDLRDDQTTTNNPAELAQLIIDWSPNPATQATGEPILDAYQCFARHLEEVGFDGSLVADTDRDALVRSVRTESVMDAIVTLVSSPSFAIRDFGDEFTKKEETP